MKQKNIHLVQLLTLLAVSFFLAFIEFILNLNSFWLMLLFFGLSFFIGLKLEGYFKKKLFEQAVQEFINSLREIRASYQLTPIVTQSIMKLVTKKFIGLVDVQSKASKSEIDAAGAHFCKTCSDTTPHVTDNQGKCQNCEIGLKFWQKMDANAKAKFQNNIGSR